MKNGRKGVSSQPPPFLDWGREWLEGPGGGGGGMPRLKADAKQCNKRKRKKKMEERKSDLNTAFIGPTMAAPGPQ